MISLKDVRGSKEAAKELIIGVDTVYIHSNIRQLGEDSYVYDEIQMSKDEYLEKLQKELDVSNKAIADLQGIDVTGQLADYAKKTDLNNKVDKVNGKALSTNDYTDAAKKKVDTIPLSPKYTDTVTSINGKTGAISKADIVALGIPSKDTNTTYSEATESSAGLMSAADKVKLNGLGGSSDLKVEVTEGDGLTFYRYGKIVVMHIFFQITQSLTSRPSNKKEVPDNLKPNKNIYGTANLYDSAGGNNIYKTTTLVQMYGGYSGGFVVDSNFTSSYTGMYCIGTMVYTID